MNANQKHDHNVDVIVVMSAVDVVIVVRDEQDNDDDLIKTWAKGKYFTINTDFCTYVWTKSKYVDFIMTLNDEVTSEGLYLKRWNK